MHKKLVLSILISVLALAPAIPASARPKETILIEDITYTVTTVKQGILKNGNLGLRLLAAGGGTIDCLGVITCEALGLQGDTATFAQVMELTFSFDPGTGTTSGEVKGRTVGQINTGTNGTTSEFRGRIRGAADCSAGVCDVSMTVRANTENGGKMLRDIKGLLENVSSLGWVFVSLEGRASLSFVGLLGASCEERSICGGICGDFVGSRFFPGECKVIPSQDPDGTTSGCACVEIDCADRSICGGNCDIPFAVGPSGSGTCQDADGTGECECTVSPLGPFIP